MAMCDSVTVSMAALTIGMLMLILRVSCVCVVAVAGTTSERAGSRRTSSNVRASGTGKWIIKFSGFLALRVNSHSRDGKGIEANVALGTAGPFVFYPLPGVY